MKQPRAFQIKPDDAAWRAANSPDIEATHWRKLPGIRCPSCGVWAGTGISYPGADVVLLAAASLPAEPWPIPLEDFTRLATRVRRILGPKRPVSPGAELGPLRGRAAGTFGDFAWVNPWTPLLRESFWLALKDSGILIAGVPAELDFGEEAHEPLLELEALPTTMLASGLPPAKCATCGRLPVTEPKNIAIAAVSFDASIPLQRIAELPTILIANEALAQFVQRRNPRDVALAPVEVCG